MAAEARTKTQTNARRASPVRVSARGRGVALVLGGLALAGVGISSYLTAAHYGHREVACGGLGQCDLVNSSQYASVLGLPVSALGLVLYLSLLTAAVAWFARPRAESLPVLYWGLALAGAGYAAYLTYVELEILHAICVWCMASATVLATSLAVSTVAMLRQD